MSGSTKNRTTKVVPRSKSVLENNSDVIFEDGFFDYPKPYCGIIKKINTREEKAVLDYARCSCSSPGDRNGAVLWEGGHFYESKGPTRWSQIGWNIVTALRQAGDHAMIMVDNVHGIELVNTWERELPNIEFQPDPCFVLKEGDMAERTYQVLADLKKISPRRKRARWAMRPRRWTCSGFALTNGSNLPTCLGYDLGLTRLKYDLGFRQIVNVLPGFYRSEQWALTRIARKVMPDLEIRAVLYDLDGNWRWLRPGDLCQPG